MPQFVRFIVAFAIAVFSLQAFAAIYRVGHVNDQDCTHSFAGAVAAANSNPGKDYIYLGFDQAGVAATVSEELEIVGGFAGCGEPLPEPALRSTLIGDANNSVLLVEAGDGLTLRNVEITLGGKASLLAGGGLWKIGSGVVSIHNSVIYNNKAQLGGGIAVTGGSGMVLLYAGTEVRDNQAQRGGGIYVDEAVLRMDYADVAIHHNSAVFGADQRYGGGIYATGVAGRSAEVSASSLTYDLGQPHPPLKGARIYLNTATDGAGLYANAQVSVTLRETSIRDNTATRYGGGIFLWGANLQMLRAHTLFAPPPLCAGLFGCNQLYNNHADFAGAAISIWNGGNAYIGQTLIAENSARSSIIDSYVLSTSSGLTNRLTLESSAIVQNDCFASTGSCSTININNTNNQSRVVLRHLTIADNRMLGGAVARAEIGLGAETAASTQVSVYSSVIEPMIGNSMVNGNQPGLVVMDCVMGPGPFSANSTRALPLGLPYRFVQRAAFDYRPADADLSIDGCDGTAIPADAMLVDAPDLRPFGSDDDPQVVNRLGAASTHDIGAFETTPLLRNGFE